MKGLGYGSLAAGEVADGSQAEGDWTGAASGMAGSEAALTDYQAWPWEVYR